MQKRIEGVKETTNQLEAPPETTLKAITAGTDATKQAGAKYIEDKKKQSSLMRFGKYETRLSTDGWKSHTNSLSV
jgi:hypothetical protein